MSVLGFCHGVSITGTLTVNDEMCPTIRAQANTNTPAIAMRMREGCRGGGKGPLMQNEVSGTLATGNDQTIFQPVDFRHGEVGDGDDTTQTLMAKGTGGYSLNYMPGTTDGYVVRRLTPTECERLQGFPDGHTDLTGCDADAVAEKVAASLLYDEKESAALLRKVRKWSQECPDGPRYKACGNSMAVPNMRWIFERIQAYDTMRETEVV